MKKALKNKASECIDEKIRQTHSVILSKPQLRELIDTIHDIPKTYKGRGKIKVIVIGQDPTIINKASRKNITTALDLDKPGKLQRYIFSVCENLGIDPLEELYATNLFKNFFEQPPTFPSDVLGKFFEFWFPILKEEIALFPDIPVITLGNNLLDFLTVDKADKCVRQYWGYTEDWKIGASLPFKHILPEENLMGRTVFPFPRQPSYLRQFFTDRCKSYIEYVKSNMIIAPHEAV